MYDELIKRLRDAATMSEALAVLLPHSEGNATAKLYNEAADAIEEAGMNISHLERDYKELCSYLPKWIPVTERLPEHLTSVIVHRKDGGIFIWEYFDTSPTDECWIDDSMNIYSFYDVAHWMPLPEPPKEET